VKTQRFETIKAILGTLGFLFVLLPVFFIGIPYKILSSPNHSLLFDIGPFRYFGWVLIIAGFLIYFWCSLSFVFSGKGTPIYTMPPKKLVVSGLYRFVRNPMYIGAFLILAGEVLLFQSQDLFAYFLLMFAIINVHVLAFEEPRLSNLFGETYQHYRTSVRRWIPRITPYRENSS
jgi:protein-S-isoprenylcysteine O-methyltransferase Ste14